MGVRGVLCLLVASATAHAAVPHVGPRIAADTLTAMPAANLTKPLRSTVTMTVQTVPPLAWSKFAQTGSWQAGWDPATGVPRRIWGSGIPAPGAMTNPAIAEQVARQVLAANIALLAPGSAPSDFVLVSNSSDGDIRSVGFVQTAGGLNVVGGQVSFRFKHDRLFVIGSEALPNVTVATARIRMAAALLHDTAAASLRSVLQLPNAPVSAAGADVVLPLVADDAVIGYRVVSPLTIDGGVDGRYQAYIDPSSAGVIAVQQLNEYATATLLYHGIDRYPSKGRVDYPAWRAQVMVNGAPATTTEAGALVVPDSGTAQVQTSIVGDLVTIVNEADAGFAATSMLAIDPGGQTIWDQSDTIDDDAQVTAYIDTNLVKDYVRNHIDANMPTLDDQMIVNVNLDQTCNSFFDGKTLNLFMATPIPAPGSTTTKCENTARVQDVNFHEYGHRVHTAEIIQGVGAFDGAMSEGAADFLAVSMSGDSGMGRGFFYNTMPGDDLDTPIRELNPPGSEWSWPVDIGEIHHQGMIFGGTFWDLRTLLISELGADAGVALTLKLYVGALRRSVDIPTTLVEALATDDDDGDLSNGTPHECEIRNTFGRHGLRTATGSLIAPGHLDENALAIGVVIQLSGLSDRCSGDEIAGAKLSWIPPFTGVPHQGSVDALPAGTNRFFAQLPLSPQQSVNYQFHVQFTDGSELILADNLADPYYQLYTGFTTTLYCTDFESGDPLANGWTTGTDDNMPSLWSWGTPTAGITDPHAAYSGNNVLALALDGDYRPSEYTWVKTPEIDVGAYTDVRVQYRRWLGVQDSYFDQARITANDTKVWQNYTEDMGTSSAIDHLDKEWRFHDVPVSGYFRGHKLTVGWDLRSDSGVQFGGWALDDVCVVANPFSICGDGVKTPTEGCDNGSANADAPDACRTDCQLPTCGDGIVDTGEECDAGSATSATCTSACKLVPVSGGCCSTWPQQRREIGRHRHGGPAAAGNLYRLIGSFVAVPRCATRSA